jgi:hypothetical protein
VNESLKGCGVSSRLHTCANRVNLDVTGVFRSRTEGAGDKETEGYLLDPELEKKGSEGNVRFIPRFIPI